MADRTTKPIMRDIKRYFGFLFDTGYRIRSVNYHPHEFGNWELTLESTNCIIEICQDRTEILVYFLPLSGNRFYRIGLKSMIYYISQGKVFIGPFKGNLFWGKKKQYEELAELLKEYHDQIVPFFGIKFNEYRNELLYVERSYFMQVLEIQKIHGR